MTVDARTIVYGTAAYAALVAAVAELKDGHPLLLVRLVVATDRIGVTARRTLARGVAGSPGIAALEVLTVRRLVEQRAGNRLAEQGRRPLNATGEPVTRLILLFLRPGGAVERELLLR